MSIFTAKNINQVVLQLTFVVVIFGTFLFAGHKTSVSSTTVLNFFENNSLKANTAFSIQNGTWEEKDSSFNAIKQKTFLEAIIPTPGLAFQHHVVASPIPNLVFLLVPLKKALLPYAPRAPGLSFISRFFPVSIQPNAP